MALQDKRNEGNECCTYQPPKFLALSHSHERQGSSSPNISSDSDSQATYIVLTEFLERKPAELSNPMKCASADENSQPNPHQNCKKTEVGTQELGEFTHPKANQNRTRGNRTRAHPMRGQKNRAPTV